MSTYKHQETEQNPIIVNNNVSNQSSGLSTTTWILIGIVLFFILFGLIASSCLSLTQNKEYRTHKNYADT